MDSGKKHILKITFSLFGFAQILLLGLTASATAVDDQRRTIGKGLFDAKSCYVIQLSKKHRSHGQIYIDWKIDRAGHVLSAEVNEDLSDVNDPTLLTCILGYARKWNFPPGSGGKTGRFSYAIWITDKGKRIEISLGE